MRYDEFRDRLKDALGNAGFVLPYSGCVEETIDVASTKRQCRFLLWQNGRPKMEPFHVSAIVGFAWSPFDSARSFTCEEDLLTEMLGRKDRPVKTERRLLRVDLSLFASLPYGSVSPVSDTPFLGPWSARLGDALDDLLVDVKLRRNRIRSIKGSRDEIQVETRCGRDGTLLLRALSVSAFRLVCVPRIWDDPERREAEQGAGEELDRVARTFKDAGYAWAAAIAELAAMIRYLPPPPEAELAQALFEDHKVPLPEV